MSEANTHSTVDWSFRPYRLLPSGHLQTIVGIHWPHKYRPYTAKLHTVSTIDPVGRYDDEQIALHEDKPQSHQNGGWKPGDAIVLLIHGLAGCHTSSYMQRCMERLTDRGYNVFRMDMRGCGAGEGLARLPAHCGRGEDVRSALEYLADLYPESPVQIVGFSLGGTITLNMLGDHTGEKLANYQRALAICPPIDLFDVEQRFDGMGGRAYDRFFVKLLWKQVMQRWHLFPEEAPSPTPPRPKRLKQIDEMVVAPGGGFASAEEYYSATQPGPKLAGITEPVTILAASDDPVVPTGPLLAYEKSESIETIVIPKGGHLGFVAKTGRDPDRRWLDWRVVDWVEAGANSKKGNVVAPPHAKPRTVTATI
ncbi:YheT family hydrolase [Adhaeretor mobilis]|uniref:Putative hydrolase n=1 Tax=Adhaeretor mobilis TaxID=1930276 RepID=A0A517N098_9BACT|nr:alpha/beta fold hydrolase [Adhaeretor mobilis]QDT00557.1 putative hydrolase [Adhaeretor mobilis]